MRRGALEGQIIIFVIGLAVVAAVLYFGYSVINDVEQRRCEIREIRFGTDLASFLDKSKAWGVANKAGQFQVPCGVTHVCFVERDVIDAYQDGETPGLLFGGDGASAAQAGIKTSVEALDPSNVFALNTEGYVAPVKLATEQTAPVAVADGINVICVEAQGDLLRIRASGDGESATVRRDDG